MSSINQELNFSIDCEVIGQDTVTAEEDENLFYNFMNVDHEHDPNQSSFSADWWNEILALIDVVLRQPTASNTPNVSQPSPSINPFHLQKQGPGSTSLESTPSLPASSSPSSIPYPSPPISERSYGATRSIKLITSKKKKNNGEHQCPQCDKRYSRKQDVKRHSSKHRDDAKEKCMYCPSSFDRKDSLKRHREKCKSRPFP
ncbi:hypothetical protein BD770DRAFT_381154 [Pilaira anomala]|nr:hypothetical protein BD770DRAFT_381154 [Pilaira anomala]